MLVYEAGRYASTKHLGVKILKMNIVTLIGVNK